jgi:hypothetical protein
MVSHELAVTLDHVAADDHRLDVGRAGAKDHRRNSVSYPIKVRRPHIDDRDVGQ